MKIVIAGAHSFIASHLIPFLKERQHEVIALSRTPRSGEHFWDPQRGELDPAVVRAADVVINLAGESILGRWTQAKRERIRKSRLDAASLLCQALAASPPKLYLGASAIGYYGDRGEEVLTEESRSGEGYLAEICREWEEAAHPLKESGVRVVHLRLGVVLGRGGGAFAQMLRSFKWGLGGCIGSGEQIMSWIAIEDVLFGIEHLLKTDLYGAVNCVAPHPVTNRAFTKALGKVVQRPTLLPVPTLFLKALLGAGAEVLLNSARVMPSKLIESGYRFRFPLVEPALSHLVNTA